MPKITCRIAPSLGEGFAGTPNEVWGTETYNPETDADEPCVFFGLYGLPDFYALWRHKGRKCILWAGSDIRHFIKGYWLDDKGIAKICPKGLAKWINANCESWVENETERQALSWFNIDAKVCPSFLGKVEDYQVQNNLKENTYYSSVSGNDFELYGWPKINKLAEEHHEWTIYLYGNTVPWEAPKNVIVRGRLSQKEMDEEIKQMTGAIRLVEFEGCSELIVKSVLWGQKPISSIKYDFLDSENPRETLLNNLNRFPWNTK